MGYFTWTDARRKLIRLANGDFAEKSKVGYGFARVICPDDSVIEEPCYEGYGIFDGKDIYELVVDWNKDHLEEIFDKLADDDPNHWGHSLKNIAVLYQNGKLDEIPAEIERLKSTNSETHLHFMLHKEWKRDVGITIACDEENNRVLPYPIKITASKQKCKYNELSPSYSCQ